jgi:pimeloyl-ACP methyl ester carboxylesterase
MNVLTLLLPGHGTDTREMLEVTAEQWRAEVERGLQMAALVGDKVIVGGFSLGAALSIDAVLRHPDIHGLLLFSPAIELRSFNGVAGFTCVPGLSSTIVETDLPPNPVKYTYRAGNGVCQLSRLMASNLSDGASAGHPDEPLTQATLLHRMGGRIRVPTFVALTYADARISPQTALAFAGEIDAPVLVVTFGESESSPPPVLANGGRVLHIDDQNLPHSYLVRRINPYNGQQNPHFEPMAEALTRFFTNQFGQSEYPSQSGLIPADFGSEIGSR